METVGPSKEFRFGSKCDEKPMKSMTGLNSGMIESDLCFSKPHWLLVGNSAGKNRCWVSS